MACPDITKFFEEFRSDESVPFGKKLQKLNAFIRSVSSSITSPEEADKFLNSIETSDFYGKKTKLELATALKRPQPILSALKSDDQSLLNRTLQFHWIYRDKDLSPLLSDPEFLVRELCPEISFSCRQKLINKLSKFCPFEELLTKIYHSVERSYGLQLAKTLIPSCTKETIINAIERKQIHLSRHQMSRIYQRYPEIIHLYIKSNKITFYEIRGWNESFGGSLLRKICKDDPQTFMTLVDKHNGTIHDFVLGSKLTSHLLKFDKSSSGVIISSPKTYSKILNPSVVKKRLSAQEYTTYFFNLFPKNVKNFQSVFEVGMKGYQKDGDFGPLSSYLERFPPSKRFSILQEGFTKAYGQNIVDYPELFTSGMLQLLPSPEDRNKWIDLNLRSPDSEYTYQRHIPLHREGYWEAFRGIPDSIEKIKAFLQKEGDVQRRGDLLASAVLSCFINKDKAALASFSEYVIARFRNDSAVVRTEYLESIDSYFNAESLDEKNWTHINELLQISSINNEFSHRSAVTECILEKSIRFGLKNNLPVEIQVQHYIKNLTRGYHHGESWRIYPKNPCLDKKCLRIFAEQIGIMFPPSIQCSSDSAIISTIISLCESISGWNKSNAKKKDSSPLSCTEFPWLMTRLQEILDSYHGPNKDRVIAALGNDKEGRAVFFPKLLKSYPHPSVISYFLKYEPGKLIENAEPIVLALVRSNNIKDWRGILKHLRSLGLPTLREKMANKSLAIAEDEDESAKERVNAVVIMSILLEPEQFLQWISKYNPPKDGKLDTYSEEAGLAYEFRKVISKTLHNLSIPSKALPTLAFYCVGDYLKLIVGAWYSLSSRSAGSQVLPILKELVNRPVSVKKHAIRLVLRFSCKCENIDFLKSLWESEKHYSIRQIIFCRIFEMFLSNNETDESWELLENAIKTLSIDDHPFLNELGRMDYVQSDLMPVDKLSPYLRLAWTTIGSLGEVCLNSKWVKVSLLQCITSDSIKYIDEAFLEEIFEKNLFGLREDPNLESSFIQVAVNYLLNSESAKKIEVIAKALERLTAAVKEEGSSWNTPNNNKSPQHQLLFPAKQALSFFVEQLSTDSFRVVSSEDSSNNKNLNELTEIFSKLLERLTSSLDPCDFFADYLFMNFSKIFHSRSVDKTNDEEEGLQDIGRQVGTLVDNLVGAYKGEIIGVISETLQRYVSICYKQKIIGEGGDGTSVLWIIQGLLKTSSLDTQIVASHLLLSSNSNPYKGHKLEGKYLEALKVIESADKTLKILVNYRRSQSRSMCGRGGYDVLV